MNLGEDVFSYTEYSTKEINTIYRERKNYRDRQSLWCSVPYGSQKVLYYLVGLLIKKKNFFRAEV